MDEVAEMRRAGELAAHVAHYPESERAPLLDRLGLEPERWPALESAVYQALSQAVAGDRVDIVAAFSLAFAKTTARLKRDAPRIGDLGPLTGLREVATRGPDTRYVTSETEETLPVAFPALGGPRGGELPFQEAKQRESGASAVAAETSRQARESRAAPIHPPSGETADVDPRIFLEMVEPPFQAPEVDTLTLEQFVACQTALAIWPELGAHILSQQGLDPQAWVAIRHTWERRRASERAVEDRYAAIAARYLEHFAHRRSTGLGPPGALVHST